MEYNFPVMRTTHPKPRPADETKLGFAKYFTDHMFVMDYDEGQGWHDGRVVPHEPFLIEPASCVLHYAQMMFEGMKAYRTPDGGIQIFRPDMNIKRMARTNERMCIPELPGDLFLHGIRRKGVCTGQIHQPDVQVMVLQRPFHPLHRNAGPVGHLQVGAGIGVEQGGFSAVGIADKRNGQFFSGHVTPPRSFP